MRFKNSYRFSPVVTCGDLPWAEDLFHVPFDQIPKNKKERTKFVEDGGYLIDHDWWKKQYDRCINGYTVEDAIEPGGDAIRDGIDCIWKHNDCWLEDYDITIKDRSVHISGRFYFYLNFWWIYGLEKGGKIKKIIHPRFIDIDFLFDLRSQNMFRYEVDSQELKGRQTGFSEKLAGMWLGYNYTFLPASVNLIVAGLQEDADHTMENTIRGLDMLINTQFYLERKRGGDSKDTIISVNGSQVRSQTAKDKPQTLSRYAPTFVLYEEVGKGKKGWSLEVEKYVRPSIHTEGKKTGYQVMIGCVCEGTKIFTNSGELKNIEDINQSDGIIGYNCLGYHRNDITYIQDKTYKPCYRIETKNGTVLECSEDHPIFWSKNHFYYNKRIIVDGKRLHEKGTKKAQWKNAKDIKAGEEVAIIESVPIFGTDEMFEPRLIGMLIGDGSYGTNHSPRLSNCDNEINEYIESRYNCRTTKSRLTNDGKLYKETVIKDICGELRNLGIYGQTKDKKRLPINIHKYTKRSLQELIAGLFDTDGCIYTYKNNKIEIIITQLSKDLIEDIKYVLLRFGISSHISIATKPKRKEERKIKDLNNYYILRITGHESKIRFVENFKLLLKYKQNKLDDILNYTTKGKACSYWVMTDYNKHTKNTNLIGLSGMSFETVKKIEYIGEKRVYNLTANYTHTYIANGVITHNTGGDVEEGVYDLEQRYFKPEYYNILSFKRRHTQEYNDSFGKVGAITPKWMFLVTDKDGNSLRKESIAKLEKDAPTNDEDKYRYWSQHPIYDHHIFMTTSGGFFGKDIIMQLNKRKIELKNMSQLQIERRGRLEPVDPLNLFKGVKFVDDSDNAWITIIEEPEVDRDGKVYANLYKAGTDSYDRDEAETSASKGALTIRKMFRQGQDSPHFNTYVALIVERPKTSEGGAEKFYYHTVLACIYYGCRNNIEYGANNMRIFDYYMKNGFEVLLQDRPDIAFAGQIKKSVVSNRYGTDASLKHQGLAILKNTLTPDFIDRMFILAQIEAFSRFVLDKDYNCDITMSAMEAEVLAKDEQMHVVFSIAESMNNKKMGVRVFQKENGRILQKFIS